MIDHVGACRNAGPKTTNIFKGFRKRLSHNQLVIVTAQEQERTSANADGTAGLRKFEVLIINDYVFCLPRGFQSGPLDNFGKYENNRKVTC